MIERTIKRLHKRFLTGDLCQAEVSQLIHRVLRLAHDRNNNDASAAFKYSRICFLASQQDTGTADQLELWCIVIEVSDWFYSYIKREPAAWLLTLRQELLTIYPQSVRYETYDYFLSHGWTVRDIVLSSIRLSGENIENYVSNDADLDHWVRLREKSLPFFIGTMFCGSLVGQWALTLLTLSEYQALLQGRLEEYEIEGEVYHGAGDYLGYISTVTLRSDFRRYRYVKSLLASAAKLLRAEWNKEVRLSQIAASAYTDEGIRMCEMLGLEYITDHQSEGKVFAASAQQVMSSRLFKSAWPGNRYR